MRGYMDMIDRWWTDWVDLFPDHPAWNPYGASFVLLIAIWGTRAILSALERRLWRRAPSQIQPGLDE